MHPSVGIPLALYNELSDLHIPPTEPAMSAKKRRKVYGVRRETRRPRGWTRWFNEGLFDMDLAGSIRLRSVLWDHK